MRLISRLRARLRFGSEEGFTLIFVLGVLVVVLASSAAVYGAVNRTLPLTTNDTQQKQAYAAAQAGIQRYLYDLDQNSEYWTQCVPANTNWIFNAGDTLVPQPVPGSSTEKYAVELLPAAGQNTYTKCSTADPVASMIQSVGVGAGTLRIRSTGWSGSVKRTLVANLREQSFLDYEYFTMYETSDPIMQVEENYQANPSDITIEPPDLCLLAGNPKNCGINYPYALAGAQSQCSQYRYDGRYSDTKAGFGSGNFYRDTYGGRTNSYSCDTIDFVSGDSINGPFHTNDQAQLCGNPTFGRSKADSIEFGANPGYVQGPDCSGSPKINGTEVAPSTSLQPPPKNSSLKVIAGTAGTYTGTTCITLSASGFTVAQPDATYPSCFSAGIPTSAVMNYPTSGVLYVQNASCPISYDVENPSYTGNTGCGTVYVQGVDGKPLTIAAESDIVIDGNLTYSDSSSMLGLIANNFIRIYHPVGNQQPLNSNSGPCTTSMTNSPDPLRNGVTVDAMMLSLEHSFVVDQYNCGNGALGKLTVDGGIAQRFRGPVGTGTASRATTGYIKDYTYDDRLRYEEPPHFIDPVQGAWRVQRQTECDTASSC